MKKFLVSFAAALAVSGLVTSCTTPLPILGVALDGMMDVSVEAKIVKESGEVVPVANTYLNYQVYDVGAIDPASGSVKPKKNALLLTDFEGKASLRLPPCTLVVSGNYSLNNGASTVDWTNVTVRVSPDNRAIRLSNDNGVVRNR